MVPTQRIRSTRSASSRPLYGCLLIFLVVMNPVDVKAVQHARSTTASEPTSGIGDGVLSATRAADALQPAASSRRKAVVFAKDKECEDRHGVCLNDAVNECVAPRSRRSGLCGGSNDRQCCIGELVTKVETIFAGDALSATPDATSATGSAVSAVAFISAHVTEADVRRITGNRAELSFAEKLVMAYTNLQIDLGGEDTNLKRNFKNIEHWMGEYSRAEASQAANEMYTNIKGAGTTSERELVEAIAQFRFRQHFLKEQFKEVLKNNSKTGTLESWVRGDLSGQWLRKANLALNNEWTLSVSAAYDLYNNMNGAGTTSEHELCHSIASFTERKDLASLTRAFVKVLNTEGKSTSKAGKDSALQYWYAGDLSGRWLKVVDKVYKGIWKSAHCDALMLFNSMKGAGTTCESCIVGVLAGYRGRMASLKSAFRSIALDNGYSGDDLKLLVWLKGDLSGSWLNQAVDAYYERLTETVADAWDIYGRLKGWGTSGEQHVVDILIKHKTTIPQLRHAFDLVLKAQGESTAKNGYHSALLRWLDGDMDFGWYQKAKDAYYGKDVQKDSYYHWVSWLAEKWSDALKYQQRQCDWAEKNSPMVRLTVMMTTCSSLQAISWFNDGVDFLASYFDNVAGKANGFEKWGARVLWFVFTLAGSLGTKAFDPKSTPAEIEQGFVDLAIMVVGWGITGVAGKALSALGKTVAGARALRILSTGMSKLSKATFKMRQALRNAFPLLASNTQVKAAELAVAIRHKASVLKSTGGVRAEVVANAERVAAQLEKAAKMDASASAAQAKVVTTLEKSSGGSSAASAATSEAQTLCRIATSKCDDAAVYWQNVQKEYAAAMEAMNKEAARLGLPSNWAGGVAAPTTATSGTGTMTTTSTTTNPFLKRPAWLDDINPDLLKPVNGMANQARVHAEMTVFIDSKIAAGLEPVLGKTKTLWKPGVIDPNKQFILRWTVNRIDDTMSAAEKLAQTKVAWAFNRAGLMRLMSKAKNGMIRDSGDEITGFFANEVKFLKANGWTKKGDYWHRPSTWTQGTSGMYKPPGGTWVKPEFDPLI